MEDMYRRYVLDEIWTTSSVPPEVLKERLGLNRYADSEAAPSIPDSLKVMVTVLAEKSMRGVPDTEGTE